MHVPDGFVSGWLNAATYAVSGAACGLATHRAGRTLGERNVPLLGMTAAFIFAAQMLNFPIGGGTSGHFLGAILASTLLGPVNAVLVMTLVLAIQCLGFGDGGITALGTNILNMALVPCLGCYIPIAALRRLAPTNRKLLIAAAAAAAWLSVVVAATFCALELAVSGTSPLKVALPAMVGVHMIIGIGEAIITVTVVQVVLAARPDLVSAWTSRCDIGRGGADT